MRKFAPNAIMEPLRITAYLQSPVISDGTLPFDSLVYSLAHREALGAEELCVPGARANGDDSGVVVPLARVNGDIPQWFYAASFAQWGPPYVDGNDHWNKRLDMGLTGIVDFGQRRGSVDIASGRYKAYHMPVFYRHATMVCWYVRGQREIIERWLPHLTHIGKKTSQGWGSILKWEIEPWPEDWSVRREGKAMRSIPAAGGLLFGFRPSYWLPQNQALCEMPAG